MVLDSNSKYPAIEGPGKPEHRNSSTAEMVAAEKRHRADRTTRCDALKAALGANG